jgi:hypothetical protein
MRTNWRRFILMRTAKRIICNLFSINVVEMDDGATMLATNTMPNLPNQEGAEEALASAISTIINQIIDTVPENKQVEFEQRLMRRISEFIEDREEASTFKFKE